MVCILASGKVARIPLFLPPAIYASIRSSFVCYMSSPDHMYIPHTGLCPESLSPTTCLNIHTVRLRTVSSELYTCIYSPPPNFYNPNVEIPGKRNIQININKKPLELDPLLKKKPPLNLNLITMISPLSKGWVEVKITGECYIVLEELFPKEV